MTGSWKNCYYESIGKLSKKTSLVLFLLQNSSSPIHPPIATQITDSTANFPLFVPRIFKIAGRASVVESLFSKVTEASAFCNSVEKSTRAWYVPKSSSSRNFEKSPFNRSCRLTDYTVCNATKNELLVS